MTATSSSPSIPPSSSGAPSGKRAPEIVTIPEKFYGMALKMKGMTVAEMEEAKKQLPPLPPQQPTPPPASVIQQPIPHQTHTTLIFVLGFTIFFLLIGGGFVYMNRDRLFAKPVVTPAPVLILPPQPPQSVAATLVSTSIALRWTDQSVNETGFRIERREGDGTYIPLTSLPQDSTSFTDLSASEGRTYQYRIFAINTGGESSASNEVSVSVPKVTITPPPAPTLPPGGLDSDSDGLSDVEEGIFGSSVRNPDTDGDGFLDGNEVFNLYNPSAKAPVRLGDSGLVTSTVSSSGWSLLTPKTWIVSTSADHAGATIQTGTGESFVIRITPLAQDQSMMTMFLADHPGLVSSDARELKTKSGLDGLATPDGKQAVFAWKDHVWSVSYDMGTQPFMNYRTTFEMMLNSLTLTGAPIVASSQVVGTPGSLLGDVATSTVREPEGVSSTQAIPPLNTSMSSTSSVSVSAPTSTFASSTTP